MFLRRIFYKYFFFLQAANPYLSMPQVGSTYSPYFAPGPIMPAIMGPDPTGVASQLSVVPQTVVTQQKMPRSDRLEVCFPYQLTFFVKIKISFNLNYTQQVILIFNTIQIIEIN